VSLTGGEPTMRADFAEIPVLMTEVLPSLTRVALTSNGYATDKILAQFNEFLPVLRHRRIAFTVNLSMDGVGETHNQIRNNKRAFGHLEDTINGLVELQSRYPFNLVLACTLTRNNAGDAQNVLAYARSRGIYVIFRNAFSINRIENLVDFPTFAPTAEQLGELREFYEKTVLDYDKSHTRSMYYSMLIRMLGGGERDIPCLYRKAGLFIDHLGDMYVCTVFSQKLGNALTDDPEQVYAASTRHRQDLAESACGACSHDVTLYVPAIDQAWDRLKALVTRVRR
jgi:MoaA/NifB/PqqE/SkfB family radical SAM enzyme